MENTKIEKIKCHNCGTKVLANVEVCPICLKNIHEEKAKKIKVKKKKEESFLKYLPKLSKKQLLVEIFVFVRMLIIFAGLLVGIICTYNLERVFGLFVLAGLFPGAALLFANYSIARSLCFKSLRGEIVSKKQAILIIIFGSIVSGILLLNNKKETK